MTQTEIFSFVVQTLYWFFLYGCIGWGVEVVYAAIKERRLVNRGFLCGPICPIYGCGMVVLNWTVAALAPSGEGKSVSTVAVFFVGMVLTTAIELVGGWTLFKIYHIRWWDYSNMKFNIGGYICPQFSLLWGLGSVIMVKVVHPALAKASSPLPMKVLVPAEAAVLALFVVDLIVSAAAATGLNKKLKEIDEVRARLRVTSDKLTTVLGVSAMTADTILDEQKLQLALAKLEGRENAAELKLEMLLRANEMRAKLRDISVDKRGTRRLLRAFPDMKSLTYAETLASTRAGVRRLNELAAAARTAAKEMAQTAKETAQTAVGTAAAAAQTAKETAANAAQSAAQTAKEAAADPNGPGDRHQHAPKHQARQRRTGPIKPIANKHALRHARRGASFLRRWFLAKTATPLSKLQNYGSTYINYIDMLIISTSITPEVVGNTRVLPEFRSIYTGRKYPEVVL